MAQHGLEQRLESAEALDEITVVPTPERRWSLRWRFLVITLAASLCWVIPGVIVYVILSRQ
jgi:hypothetical protein